MFLVATPEGKTQRPLWGSWPTYWKSVWCVPQSSMCVCVCVGGWAHSLRRLSLLMISPPFYRLCIAIDPGAPRATARRRRPLFRRSAVALVWIGRCRRPRKGKRHRNRRAIAWAEPNIKRRPTPSRFPILQSGSNSFPLHFQTISAFISQLVSSLRCICFQRAPSR